MFQTEGEDKEMILAYINILLSSALFLIFLLHELLYVDRIILIYCIFRRICLADLQY